MFHFFCLKHAKAEKTHSIVWISEFQDFIFHISFGAAVGKMKYGMGCPGSTLVVFKVFLTIPWNCKCTSRWEIEQPTQGRTGRRRLAAHNERRHPAKRARSCGSMPHWGIDRCATPQHRPLQTNCQTQLWLCGCSQGRMAIPCIPQTNTNIK